MPRKDEERDPFEDIKLAKNDDKMLGKVLSKGKMNDFEMDMLMLDE
jgi:hypothetical protein